MIGIPGDMVDNVWDRAQEWIAQALEYGTGEYETDDILGFIRDGAMQLWMTDKSCAVTTLVCYPRRKVCLVLAGAGDLEDMNAHLWMVEEWAHAMGCNSVVIDGRKGWARALSDYEQTSVTLTKELSCIPSSEIH